MFFPTFFNEKTLQYFIVAISLLLVRGLWPSVTRGIKLNEQKYGGYSFSFENN